MRLQFNSAAAVMALLVFAPVPAQAQGMRPATSARPSTITPTSPTTVTGPDEATTGRATVPSQPGTVSAQPETPPAQAGTAPGQAGTTPGQAQTSPGQASELTPAVTGQTPSSQSTMPAKAGQLAPATRTDIKAGTSVYDQNGAVVGKVESVSARGAVISTGTTRATIPVSSFAKGDKGLVIGLSKADIDATAKKKSPK